MPDLPIDLIKEAVRNAKENGYEQEFRAMSLAEQVHDLERCDAQLEKFLFRDLFPAYLEALLEIDVVYLLNKLQFENRKHRLLDPVHAIQFALRDSCEGLSFLKCWNEGDWAGCAQWPEWKGFRI